MAIIKDFKEISKKDALIAGGKGASLGEMTRAGIPVPSGFVILSNAFEKFLEQTDLSVEISSILHSVNHNEIHTVESASEKIKALILSAKIPEDITNEIQMFFNDLDAKYVAVRSSATAEDSATAAWAGQLESYLNTTSEMLLENIKKCWASLFTPRAIFYRFEKKLNNQKISVAVVVQKMVQSEVSGIAFSVHPVTQDKNQLIIESGFGLGEAIVSGQITPDSYVIEKEPRRIINKSINVQTKLLIRNGSGGNRWKTLLKEKGEKQTLFDYEIFELADLIIKLENHYGFPVDVEWAREKDRFYIVQSRPITTLQRLDTKIKNMQDKWILVENIPDSDIFFFQIPFRCFTATTNYSFIKKLKKVMAIYKGFEMDFYFPENDAYRWSEEILKSLIKNPQLGKDIHRQTIKWSHELVLYAKKIKHLPLNKYSNKKLWELYSHHHRIHTKLYTYGWYPVQVDILYNNFTNTLKNYLYKVCSSKQAAEESFIVLTTPLKKTIVAKEREDFLGIYKRFYKTLAQISRKRGIFTPIKLKNELNKHSKRWGHLGYIYAGNAKPFNREYYLNDLIDLVKSKVKAANLLKKEKKQLMYAKKKQQVLYAKLRIPALYKKLFRIAIDFSLSKLIRRDAQLFALHILHSTLLNEISSRLKISRQQVQFMLRKEVENALKTGVLNRKLLSQRLSSCVYLVESGKERVYVGARTLALTKDIQKKIEFTENQFFGQTAQPGHARGRVKIIIRAQDMKKMEKGDILVSIATDPDIVSAMKKAGAIVTDQGGITSHAAIVARELGTPCVIGTKIASKILKDGDIVEVDASGGVVKIVEKAK